MLGKGMGGRIPSAPIPSLWLYIFSSASLVISKAARGSWGPVGSPGGDRPPGPEGVLKKRDQAKASIHISLIGGYGGEWRGRAGRIEGCESFTGFAPWVSSLLPGYMMRSQLRPHNLRLRPPPHQLMCQNAD